MEEQQQQQAVGEFPPPPIASKKKKQAQTRRCDLCGVTCNGKKNYDAHIQGAKHQKALTKPTAEPIKITPSKVRVTAAAALDDVQKARKSKKGKTHPQRAVNRELQVQVQVELETCRRQCVEAFVSAENPYETALALIEASPDYAQPRTNTRSLAILNQFASWIREAKREETYRDLLTREIQKRAFHVATNVDHTILLRTVVKLFKLTDVGEMFVDDVRAMATNRLLVREAAECADALRIQQHFGLNEILIPCIVLNSSSRFMKPYLSADVTESQRQVMEVVQALDELCVGSNFKKFFALYDTANLRGDKVLKKKQALGKLLARLIKFHNIPPESTPNLVYNRNRGALQYVLSERYENGTMNDENWDDMIKLGVKTCPELLNDLFGLLASYKDYGEAAKWAEYYKVVRAKLPPKLLLFMDQNPGAVIPGHISATNGSTNNGAFLCLPIARSDVIVVDNEISLLEAIRHVESAEIIGLDAEWQPGFGRLVQIVDLLQVATHDRVFLIDIPTLKNSANRDVLKDAMRRLFCSDSPRKLGFGFFSDIKSMIDTLPFCKPELENPANLVCIQKLTQRLVRQNAKFVDDAGSAAPKKSGTAFSLTALCQHFLGKPLDKSEQISNWTRRPLRWNQIQYAALDAYCLLSIYEKLRCRAEELNVDFEKTVKQSVGRGTSKRRQ